ncbi:MAG TPA: DUF2157 domain-containing protein [Saprospiraceae bacterium]|nr:DUF2157 domain-containing protein [Saprospiraceae bacterium]HPN68040.1 DUF2157 domain-containing protein [Saprospiraceae bacterium]
MAQIERDDIHLISRHSNLPASTTKKLLKDHVYNDRTAWVKFLKLFFISLGVGFTVSGILFFFAYNWADLHKFAKLGLVQGLLIAATLTAVFSKLSKDIKDILLTGSAILIGVLFAVYGQIYQTGANAYDFFLGWTIFTVIWAVMANYAVLWVLFILLINTTIFLYAEQVADHWSDIFVMALQFVINSLCLAYFLLRPKDPEVKTPEWFINLLAISAVSFATLGIVNGIFNTYEVSFLGLIIITLVLYGLGIKYGWENHKTIYFAIIPLSIIIIIAALLIKVSYDAIMFFVITLFVIGSVTLVIKNLIDLQKKWKNG